MGSAQMAKNLGCLEVRGVVHSSGQTPQHYLRQVGAVCFARHWQVLSKKKWEWPGLKR